MTGALPSTMPAAVLQGPRELTVEEVPLPDLGPRDVAVEIGWCGVCGSDLHFVIDGWGRPGSIGGHEWSGTIVAVGNEVDEWTPGDPVVGGPSPTCGKCDPCRAGRPSLCVERATPGTTDFVGAFARYKIAGADDLLAVPDGLGLREAALTEPLAVALHAVTRSGVEPGQRAFVSGAGPIGALVVAALKALGVDEITVSEPTELRRDLVARLGASTVVHPDDLDVPAFGDPMRSVDGAHHVAIDCSGRGVAMEAALGQLGKGGTLVIAGSGMERPKFDPMRILLNELVVTGAFEYDADGFPRALELLSSGRVPTDLLIEPNDVSLSGLLDSLERLARGEIAGKVLVAPDRQE